MPVVRLSAFVDAHVHLSQTGFVLGGLDLSGTSSREEVLAAVESYARRSSDLVILGAGWDESGWPDPTLPTLDELEQAAPGRLVSLARVDGHSGLVSGTVAARVPDLSQAVGWDGTSRVERNAWNLIRDACDNLVTRAQRKAAIARALDAAAAAGIGCVHEMGAPHINSADDFELIRELASERPQIEVVPYWGKHASAGGVEEAISLGCAGAAGDLNVDGAFGSRTAGLVEPYVDGAGAEVGAGVEDEQHRGHTYLDADAVAEHVIACTQAGIQAGFHCIGDAGTAAAAEGFRLASKTVGVDAIVAARHRLEHVELIDPEHVAILAECGVAVSAQPAFDALWGGSDGMYAARLGPERALATNPLAGLAFSGLRLAFGSDSPVTPFDPWGAIRAAVYHHNVESRLFPAEAFAAHTKGGRFAAKQDGGVDAWTEWEYDGELGPDGLPDFDPGSRLPRCLRTTIGGRTVYENEDL